MISRRELLHRGALTGALLGLPPAFWRVARTTSATPGAGPYGPLQPADANGVMLPQGFSSRIVARGGLPVEGTGYVWPQFPDGSATYPVPGGGWILVCNSEVPNGQGGASAIRFRPDGTAESAYRVLGATSSNCAGGRTPWGTWMSCEEHDDGEVWECDPTGSREAVAHPVMGRFKHEAVAVDPVGQQVYLTEDQGDGGFYRFTPDAYPDCSKGRLEVAVVSGSRVSWAVVPRPLGGAADPLRKQVPSMTQFKRGEGIYYDAGMVYVSTTSDNIVHAYDTRTQRISALYDAGAVKDPPLINPDNIVVSASGDVFVGEDDGGDDPLDLGIITPEGEVARFLKLTGIQHGGGGETMSEVTGPSFDPSGKRLYLSSQRAYGLGVVYEITGPFRLQRPAATPPAVRPRAVGPALAVEIPRRRQRSKLLRKGLPIALTLDRAATVDVRVTARVRGKSITVARMRRRIDAGPEQLLVKLTKAGRKRVGKRLHVEVRVGTARFRRTVRVT